MAEYNSPQEIIARLQDLRQRQEEHQYSLQQAQTAQRQLLKTERDKLVVTLGLDKVEKSRALNVEQHQQFTAQNKNTNDVESKIPAKPFLKRGEGLKARFKVDPDKFKLDNLPKYKFANRAKARAKNPLKQSGQRNEPGIQKILNEKITVEPMVPEVNLENAFIADDTDFDVSFPAFDVSKAKPHVLEQWQCEPPVQPSLPWKVQLQNDPSKRKEPNMDVVPDVTMLLALLEDSIDESGNLEEAKDCTIIPRNVGSEPSVVKKPASTIFEKYILPDLRQYIEHGSDMSGFTDIESDDIEAEQECQQKTVNFSWMCTPKDKSEDHRTTTTIDIHESSTMLVTGDDEQKGIREDILEMRELLKKRLTELDTEIESFRRENAELMRMKQEHELETTKLQQDREEMMEKLNDERIKMEVYFHDERIKIDEERQKALKEALRPTKKETEVIRRLKEQNTDLLKDAKVQEIKHAAKSARFRSHIKNLENALRDSQLKLEVFKKENKKLETENAHLKRHNNNHMLSKINKSLSKLVPPSTEPSNEHQRSKSPEKPQKNACLTRIKPIEIVEKNVVGKVAKVNVISHPPEKKKSNVLQLSNRDVKQEILDDSSSSSDDTSSGTASYFQGKAKKGLFPVEKVDEKHQETEKSPKTADLTNSLNRQTFNDDGSREVYCPNGNLHKTSPEGLVLRTLFFDNNIKEINLDEGAVKYYYSENNVWRSIHTDGVQVIQYANGQTERFFKDGSTEVYFPNGSKRTTNPNSEDIAEEWEYADGTTSIIKKNGDKVFNLPNGHVEIHTKAHRRRIFPSGTVKFIYPDGTTESRYKCGRVRIKDSKGMVISDTGGTA